MGVVKGLLVGSLHNLARTHQILFKTGKFTEENTEFTQIIGTLVGSGFLLLENSD
jgi:hypothetical protein